MIVGESIDGSLAVAPERDKIQVPQQPQLVRDGGLAHLGHHRKIAHAQLTHSQREYDTQASRIAERSQDVARALQTSGVGQLRQRAFNRGTVVLGHPAATVVNAWFI